MRKIGHIAFLWILTPLVAGCMTAKPYVQNRPPVPLITHQGELNISGGIDFPSAGGYDYQAVYAPWDHISFYAGFQFDRGYEGTLGPPDSSDYFNRFFELGLGYFDTVHWANYEAYLLAGFGTGSDHLSTIRDSYSDSYTDTTTLNVFRLGTQQNIGIEGSAGAIGIGLGLGYERLFNVNRAATSYHVAQTPYTFDTVLSDHSYHETSSQAAFYAEPVIFWRLGWKAVKIMQEIWWAYRTNHNPVFPLVGGLNESLTLSLDF
jgi:hypothetical protein